MRGSTPRFGRFLLFVFGFAMFDLAAGDAYRIRNGTISAGSAVVESADSVLIATVGEPGVGTMSNDLYRITSGVAATFLGERNLQPDEIIFSDGFEP
jgi:hypothetical protein